MLLIILAHSQLVSVRHESLVDELQEALADLDEKPEIIPGDQGVIEVSHHLIPPNLDWFNCPHN